MHSNRSPLRYLTLFLLVLFCIPLAAQEDVKQKTKNKEKNDKDDAAAAALPAEIWKDRGPIAELNLIYGAGGKEHAPNPQGKYTFVREDMEGTSPKFDVKDAEGTEWRVKLRQEPQSETAATRFLWAVGYFTDEDYYLPEIVVQGLPKLHRGQNYVSKGGLVRRVRLERKPKKDERKKLGQWDWFDNPFAGTREFNGLRVMMSLLNNWDLKEINNSVYEENSERDYVVSDVGATFGRTGNYFTRSKGQPQEYAKTKFVESVTPTTVSFVLHSRPALIDVVQRGNYQTRTHMEDVCKNIPRADARWLGDRLGQLTDDQLSDAFRAAGYDSGQVAELVSVVKDRIAELKAL